MNQEQHWSGYLNALGSAKHIPQTSMPLADIYPNTSSQIGVSGFLDLTPRRPEIQAKYDAMSGNWGGIEATNKALAHGLFSTDPAPLSKNYGKNK